MTANPTTDTERFIEAIDRLDRENACDWRSIDVAGESVPLELHYARRVTHWIHTLEPDPSEALLLAARSQHIGRWRVPRDTYPATRAGYLKWRADLKQLHAETSGGILAKADYSEATIDRVKSLNLKLHLGSDSEAQTLEDALCLVTLELQIDDLIARTEHGKMVEILRKTWRKMSPAAHKQALAMPLSSTASSLIAEALDSPSEK